MFYEDYQLKQAEYSQGFKKVSIITEKLIYFKDFFGVDKKLWGRNCDLFFNEKGKLIQSIELDPDYNSKSKLVYAYDSEGQLTSIVKINPHNFPAVELSNFKYNEDGKIEKEISFTFHNESAEVYTAEDEYYYEGERITIITTTGLYDFRGDNEIFLKYDDKKRIIEQKAKQKGEQLSWEKFEYEEEKNIEKNLSFDYFGKIIGFSETQTIVGENSLTILKKTEKGVEKRFIEFIKNAKGDWLKKWVYIDDVLHHIIKREIVYY